jgi:hypothetical protein
LAYPGVQAVIFSTWRTPLSVVSYNLRKGGV